MARVVVTGAAGFVGRALLARLAAGGESPVALVRRRAAGRPEPDLVLDLARASLPAGVFDGVSVVFHLAARTPASRRDGLGSDGWRRVNVEGTRAVAEAARAAGARLVHVSSVAVYGTTANEPVEEGAPLLGSSPYARSKVEGEAVVFDLARRGLAAVVVRPSPVYGPGHHGRLSRMLGAVRRGLFPPPADGAARSHLHVENLVDALLLLARHPSAVGRAFNVADAAPESVRAIFDAAVRTCGVRPLLPAIPASALRLSARAGDAAGWLLGRPLPWDSQALERLRAPFVISTRLLESLGWVPRLGLRDALPALLGRDGGRA